MSETKPLAKKFIKSPPKKNDLSIYKNFMKDYNSNDSKDIQKIVKKLTRDKFKKKPKEHKSRNNRSRHKPDIKSKSKSKSKSKIIVKKIEELKPVVPVPKPVELKPVPKPALKSRSKSKRRSRKHNKHKKHRNSIDLKQDIEYIMKIKKKINHIKKHSLSRKKYSCKKTKNRHVIVNLKYPTSEKTKKKNKEVKKKIDKMSSKDLRDVLIKKNVIKKDSKTPDKLLKDIYMYSELCNVNISK
jgi:hypothetical protein